MCGRINLLSHYYLLFRNPTFSLNLQAEFKSAWREEFTALWKQKPLHGQFTLQIEAISTTTCAYQWLRLLYLKIETEAMITAAQDQAIRKKAYNVNVLHSSNDSLSILTRQYFMC